MDDVRTAPCPTSVLYSQSGGNLHCFTSVSSCAVLDVLAPPYCEDAGRSAHIFTIIHFLASVSETPPYPHIVYLFL